MSNKMTFDERIIALQDELIAPKGQWNAHGKFKYRNCEDILLAAKPVLRKYGLRLKLSDEIIVIESRLHIKVTATIIDGQNQDSVTAFAEIPEAKGMIGVSQATGAASSYARKYALGGLLLVDDSRDEDSMSGYDRTEKKEEFKEPVKKGVNVAYTIRMIGASKTEEELKKICAEAWKDATDDQKKVIRSAYDSQKERFLGSDEIGQIIEEMSESVEKLSKSDRLVQQVKAS